MNSEWHLLKDKRPRNKQVVLGVDKTGYITRFTYDSSAPPGFMDDHEEWFPMTDIIAWMPMPKYHPPKEVRKRECS